MSGWVWIGKNDWYFSARSGAQNRIRTGDLVLTKDVLCQLSYLGRPEAGTSEGALAMIIKGF